MNHNQIIWTKFLDILTDNQCSRRPLIERATDTEQATLFLLKREGWTAQIASNSRDFV